MTEQMEGKLEKFTEEQKKSLSDRIQRRLDEARKTAKFNQRLDISFKILLLILTIATTASSVIIASYITPPFWLPKLDVLLAGISTAISGFAFVQFNFGARYHIWTVKADSLEALLDELSYSNPDKAHFLQRLSAVIKIGDHSSPPGPPMGQDEDKPDNPTPPPG